jgi:hypothetical protein
MRAEQVRGNRRLQIMSGREKAKPEWAIVDASIEHRMQEITAWLRDNQVFEADPEEMGSVERAYWHFGYLRALEDMRLQLQRRSRH